MSEYKSNIYANFLHRKSGRLVAGIPIINRITINKDLRQLCDTFDFDIEFGINDKIELSSHDFVEFYTLIDKEMFPISCGFIEDFTKETSSGTHKFQANGRDFLGQLLGLPFLNVKPFDQTNLVNFVYSCLEGSYLLEWCKFKGINGQQVIDQGSYKGPVNVPELSSAKRGPVLQQTADEVYSLVYQNRFGQAVVWGRDARKKTNTGHTLSETKDLNVSKFTLRENFSKVISEVKLFYSGGEGKLNYHLTPSKPQANTEAKAKQIFQPEIRIFNSATLVTTAGAKDLNYENKKDELARSILRKSNQHLTQVVIKTNRAFYVSPEGIKKGYEVNQVWQIKSESFKISEPMRLAGISYAQSNSGLEVELMFIMEDSLV